ncbi:MAG: hypothetical protein ACKVU2_12095, partial [Saprospiraceae bacterium]
VTARHTTFTFNILHFTFKSALSAQREHERRRYCHLAPFAPLALKKCLLRFYRKALHETRRSSSFMPKKLDDRLNFKISPRHEKLPENGHIPLRHQNGESRFCSAFFKKSKKGLKPEHPSVPGKK